MCPTRKSVLTMLFAVSCLVVLAIGLSVYAQAPAPAPAAPAAPAAPVAPKPVVVAPVAAAVELKDIVDTVAADAELKTLSKAIVAAGLVETLKGKGPLTLLAPNDKAFAAAYPGDKLEALLKNKEELTHVLRCHVIADKAVAVADLKKMTESGLTCMATHKHAVVVKEDAGVTVDGAKIVKADVKASNGLVQVLDKLAMPAMAAAPAATTAPVAPKPAAAPAPTPAPAPAPAK